MLFTEIKQTKINMEVTEGVHLKSVEHTNDRSHPIIEHDVKNRSKSSWSIIY